MDFLTYSTSACDAHVVGSRQTRCTVFHHVIQQHGKVHVLWFAVQLAGVVSAHRFPLVIDVLVSFVIVFRALSL